MTKSVRVTKAAAAVLLSAVLVACGGESTEGQAQPQAALEITGAGATFPEPLYQQWIAQYKAEKPDVYFTYTGVGSGEGIKRFIAEEVDFGASDAAMKDEEIARVKRGVKLIPVTAGMLVLAYNLPGVEGELRLPRDVYVDIFLGKIWCWDNARIVAANPDLELPPKLIQTIVRRDSSGTTYAFTNHLSTISPDWREEGPGTAKLIDWPGGAMTGSGNEGVAQKVKISHGSIGYMEYGFAKRLGLPVALLENKTGAFVKPDANSGRAAIAAAAATDLPEDLRLFLPDPDGPDSYPILSLSWILLYGQYDQPEKASALKDAITWGLTRGQVTAEEIGYIPLPESLVSKGTQAVESIQVH
jgi:phosphate transport system substrate-binding protein